MINLATEEAEDTVMHVRVWVDTGVHSSKICKSPHAVREAGAQVTTMIAHRCQPGRSWWL